MTSSRSKYTAKAEHSNHVTSSKGADTLICHTTMRRNHINGLYNPDHVSLYCVEVSLVANARQGSTQEHDWARVPKLLLDCLWCLSFCGDWHTSESHLPVLYDLFAPQSLWHIWNSYSIYFQLPFLSVYGYTCHICH